MSLPRALPAFAETSVLLALGFVAVFAALIPLSPGGGLVAPDLVYCLVVAWVIRRPARTPLWAVVLLGLLADVMLSRPIGLGALALVLFSETFRRRAVRFHGAPFLVEWLAAAAGFAAMLGAMHLVLELVFAHPPGLAASLGYVLVTALAYPLVVLGLTWCLRLRAPRVSEGAYRLGRLS
jgi:rod shape-determining protein MreD